MSTHWNFNDSTNSFFIKSWSNIKKGDEVFDSYGIRSNKIFLLYYGFTIENNNSHNKFRIRLTLNNSYPFIKEKMMHLGYHHENRFFELGLKLHDKKVKELFSLLRFILYDKEDFRNINSTNPISVENEIDIFNKIREIMTNYINRYPTTMDYDIDYLNRNKNTMEFNEYNCYVIRIGEKEILHFYLSMANEILESIKNNNITSLLEYKQLFNGNKFSTFNKNYSYNYSKISMKYRKYIFPN
jgi:histone-lysine N-methyltransferase SETD3